MMNIMVFVVRVSQLAGACDVLVENYLPGKLHEMGLGYEQLSRVNQQLIYCSISGTDTFCSLPVLVHWNKTNNVDIGCIAAGVQHVKTPKPACTSVNTTLVKNAPSCCSSLLVALIRVFSCVWGPFKGPLLLTGGVALSSAGSGSAGRSVAAAG